MKKTILICFSLFLFVKVFSQPVTAELVLGTWLTASGKAKVQIYKDGDFYNGKIVWLKEPVHEDGKFKVDKNNSDKTKRDVPLLGLKLLKNFKFKDGEWSEGFIYDPENGKTYSCFIKYRDGKLDLRGYLGISLIGRTQTWFKVADIK